MMKNNISRGKRVILSEGNRALTQKLLKELKDKNCKLSLTEIVNEALSLFFNKQYAHSKKHFEKKFFDRKSYLKKLLQSESIEDLDESLKSFVKKLPSQSKKKVGPDES